METQVLSLAQRQEQAIREIMRNIRKKHRNGKVLCDMGCGRPAAERHHIWPRSLTMGNAAASIAANSPYVTAMLCRECHDTIDYIANRNALLWRLYDINGRGDTYAGYQLMYAQVLLIERAMKTSTPIHLPEPP